MIEPVTLEDLKAHLRIEAGVADEDVYLQSLVIAARRFVELHTGRTITGTEPTLVGDDLEAARHAMRLLIGSWYNNREGMDLGSAPAAIAGPIRMLLDPLKKWFDGESLV